MSALTHRSQLDRSSDLGLQPGELHSDLARLSLPETAGESYQKFAWTDSVCGLFLLVGLIGFYQPRTDVPPAPPAIPDTVEVKTLTPDLIQEPPPAPPQAEPQPTDQAPADAPNVEAPAPIPVAELTAAVQFSVPVEGPTTIVPVERASAPTGKPNPQVAANPNGTGISGPAFYQQSYGRGGMVVPKYPRELDLQHISGVVGLLLTVDAEGHAINVEVEKKSGHREFDQEALRCAKHPASLFNTPGPGLYRIEVQFNTGF